MQRLMQRLSGIGHERMNEWISAAKAVALLKGSLDDFQAAGAAEAAAVLAGGKFSGWQWRSPRCS